MSSPTKKQQTHPGFAYLDCQETHKYCKRSGWVFNNVAIFLLFLTTSLTLHQERIFKRKRKIVPELARLYLLVLTKKIPGTQITDEPKFSFTDGW